MNITTDQRRDNENPFHDLPDPELFFPEAGREKLCQALILDLLTGKQLLHLGGEAGAGKTLTCQVIMERLPSTFQVVYIENPEGSFDDLIKYACLSMGTYPESRTEDVTWPEEFNKLLALHQEQNTNSQVLLIIDEGEKLFAATLDRLINRNRKPQETEPPFALLLSGRGELQYLLQQLSALAPENRPDASYTLSPLSPEETEKYLQYRLHAAGLPWDSHVNIFNTKTVTAIWAQSQGNLRQINTYAAKLVDRPIPAKRTKNRKQKEPKPIVSDFVPVPEPDLEESYQANYPAELITTSYDILMKNKLIPLVLLGVSLFFLVTGFILNRRAHSPTMTAKMALEQVENKNITAQNINDSMDFSQIKHQIEVEAGEVKDNPPPSEQPDGQKILQRRLAASTALIAASYRGEWTILLLSLSGEKAEKELVQLLVSPDLYPVVDQIYLVHGRDFPTSFYLYYGIYNDMEAARVVRNNMPVNLRKHHPYPVPIVDALKENSE